MQTQTLEDARRLIASLTDPDGLPESPVLIYNDDQREGTSYLRLSISYGKGDDGYRPKPRGYYLHVMRKPTALWSIGNPAPTCWRLPATRLQALAKETRSLPRTSEQRLQNCRK